ncbi:L7Ae/L30e/S12e/Gadd45 family ribosomal protein [Floccifex sp.]|uniref:L7Ae/L30e/S12e/Gadd45 family ribosomal protein n=1 Tax=Floccifex sp. TaxID=2815810 RepID=UPI003F0CE8A7
MNKIVSLCQLAFRARKVSFGSFLIPSIQNKEAKLVIYSSGCGENRKKKLKDKCAFYQIKCIELDEILFNQITQKNLQSFSIVDSGFANSILSEMKG